MLGPRRFVWAALIASGLGCCHVLAAQQDSALHLFSPYKAVWTGPPQRTPARHSVGGPLLGNGDMGVCLGGKAESLRFYLSKNDFWRLKSQYGQSGPRVFGYLDVAIDALKGANYRIEQTICDGVATATLKRGPLTIRAKSWAAATENVLVVALSAEGGKAEARVRLSAARGNGSQSEDGRDGRILYAVRTFARDVDILTEAAAAMRIIGADEPAFALTPVRPVTIVVAMTSRFKHREPLAYVKQQVGKTDLRRVARLRRSHERWWARYWQRSWVRIGDPVLEQAYYQALYSMGASSRDPTFPPGLFGTWVTTDSPAWAGDYHLNYNHSAPFYALYSANRIDQADPEDAPILDFRKRGRWYAENVTQTRGVLYPVGIGPLGIETTRAARSYAHGPKQEHGGLFLQQRSNSAYCLVNIAQRWRTTYDPEYGRKVYPFVREVADFWEDYLKYRNGHYVIVGDAIHEGSGQNVNPILSLGLVRNTFDLALDMSVELDVDAERREKWTHILTHLSLYPTQEMKGKAVFRYTERGPAWWRNNTLGIQHIYPGNAIGLDSDPKWIDVARNTIQAMGRWLDRNGSNSFFPAAVRVAYDPHVILEKLRRYAQHTYPNGFQHGNPHGIENCSTVPNTINEMLCMSHAPVGDPERPESVIRVFAVWPRNRDATFHAIRTWGAFLVSSELKNGRVRYVSLHSERGRDCTMVHPWPTKSAQVFRDGKPAETLRGERVTFKTTEGEEIVLAPVGVSLEDLHRGAAAHRVGRMDTAARRTPNASHRKRTLRGEKDPIQ